MHAFTHAQREACGQIPVCERHPVQEIWIPSVERLIYQPSGKEVRVNLARDGGRNVGHAAVSERPRAAEINHSGAAGGSCRGA